MQTLTSRGVGDAAAGLGLHFLHMSVGPFSHDAGQMLSEHSSTPLFTHTNLVGINNNRQHVYCSNVFLLKKEKKMKEKCSLQALH